MACRTRVFFFSVFCFPSAFAAEPFPTHLGQTGLITMPDGQVTEDGDWRMGASYAHPYSALWTSITVLPRFEFSARFTTIHGADLPSTTWEGYGDYKDKAFDAKLQLLKEGALWPSLAIGTQDFLGTRIFGADFIAATKHFGDLQLTLGYGTERLNGAFGGLRYSSSWAPSWSLVAEYDSFDYQHDHRAKDSGADKRDGGFTYGLEYRWGWLGAQISRQGDTTAGNLFLSVPLGRKEFIPKIHEPAPDTTVVPQVPAAEWGMGASHTVELVRALEDQGFKNIKVNLEGDLLALSLTHGRITRIGRAVGRAARTALLRGPENLRVLKITYTENDLPLQTYTFSDVAALSRHFAGELSASELEATVSVEPSDPKDHARFKEATEYALDFDRSQARTGQIEMTTEEGEFIVLKQEQPFLRSWRVSPFNLAMYLNDPSGVFHYNLFMAANYSDRLAPGLFLNGALRATLAEDVSDVTQPSNSELPHVRSDIAEYTKDGKIKLDTLLLNKYFKAAPRLYGRLSAGLYEEMFGGAGGQLLYLPEGNWAADLTVDWLRQRETGGGFEFRDYETVTALAGLHYRFPTVGLTATLRAGRFLAKDDGYRFELKRRFRSGFEYGAWYTVTNGNDVTPPGSPGDPYYDKGLFLTIPLASMLTKDTQIQPSMSIAPWTRDVGQMVQSPGDLYGMLDRRMMLDAAGEDPFADLRK